MAVNYANYVYNHMPNYHRLAQADIFTGSQDLRHKLRVIHVR